MNFFFSSCVALDSIIHRNKKSRISSEIRRNTYPCNTAAVKSGVCGLKRRIGFVSFARPIKSVLFETNTGTGTKIHAYKLFLYWLPQSRIASRTGFKVKPSSESEYSTRGGTSAKTSRSIRPSSSKARRLSVNTFLLMDGIVFKKSVKRCLSL